MPHPGSPITLTFALPGGSALLRASGVVVNDTLAGTFRRTGVRFSALPEEVEQRISQFCQATQDQQDLDALSGPGQQLSSSA